MQPKDLINRLECLGAVEPKVFCYLENENGNDYEKDLCRDCAKKMMKDTDFLGYTLESDSPKFCDECGELLAVELTLSGVEDGLEHYERNFPQNNDIERRHLVNMLEAITPEDDCYDQVVDIVEKYLLKIEGAD